MGGRDEQGIGALDVLFMVFVLALDVSQLVTLVTWYCIVSLQARRSQKRLSTWN
jgi:hypothetical protein